MRSNRPTACFLGTRLEPFLALGRYADIVSAWTTKESRLQKHCAENNRASYLIEDKNQVFEFLVKQNADIVFSAGFPYIIPDRVFKQSRSKFINVHPSLLPAYKGANAIRQAYEDKEPYMGATVHYMVREVDAGPLIWQEKVCVKGFSLKTIYEILFSIVEPFAVSKAMGILTDPDLSGKG